MKNLTPLKAIRKHCLECCGGSRREVELCTANPKDIAGSEDPELYTSCSLYQYRFGTNPRRHGVGGRKKNATGIEKAVVS